MDQPARFQDFVIVHELLHLRLPGHGRLFKAMLAVQVPEWRLIARLGLAGATRTSIAADLVSRSQHRRQHDQPATDTQAHAQHARAQDDG